ncbi:MAG: ATPase, T2SS/T4P/T4SS family [Candidatus Gastranaerophilaceae bacterium]
MIEKIKKNINGKIAQKIPFEIIERERFFPINEINGIMFVAVDNINNQEKLKKLTAIINENYNSKSKFIPVNDDEMQELLSLIPSGQINGFNKIEQKQPQFNSKKVTINSSILPGKKRLGDMLLEKGMITEEQLQQALNEAKRTGEPIGHALVSRGFVDIEELKNVLSEQQGVDHVNSEQLRMTENHLKYLPTDFIIENKIVPLSSDGKNIIVGMVNPNDKNTLNEVVYLTGLRPTPLLITHIEFEQIIKTFLKEQEQQSRIFEQISAENATDKETTLFEQVEKEIQDDSSTIAKFVNQIITDGIDKKASDIHIEPRNQKYIVRYRTDGILKKVLDIPDQIQSSVISRFKVIARMNIAEHRRAQDGTFSIKYKNKSYDFRINTLPVGLKEKMVVRILQPSVDLSTETKEIKLIGAYPDDIKKIEWMTKAPNGIILTSGPTGSGKTTTLYSVLKTINDEGVNITTIEDPIEIRIEGINQTQVNPKADITFASCMRAILRQDPDIILVGEIRDKETLEAAISAALTGHLVLSTIHTNSAAATVTRLAEMGAKNYLIASSLTGVIAQRLVRRLCPHCKTPYCATKDEAKQIFTQIEDAEQFTTRKIFKAAGCDKCNHEGFVGRLGVYEIMPINKEIKKLIAQSAPDVEIEDVAISCGMKTLYQSCLEHIINGETSISEFVRVLGVVND